jgi:hypothetical protein
LADGDAFARETLASASSLPVILLKLEDGSRRAV